MNEQNKPDGAPAQLPGYAIIALILGLFVFQDTFFESSRPAMSEAEKSSSEDVRSRLWQDPFEAVTLHRKKFRQFPNENNYKITVSDDDGTYAYQLDQSIQRVCYSNDPDTRAHSIKELRCQMQLNSELANENASADGVHVLAVMVPGGPYAEDQEWRLRSRFALISGLSAAGYVPEEAEHIGFVDFSSACKSAIDSSDHGAIKFCDNPAYMPYEWFKPLFPRTNGFVGDRRNPLKKILVLWLDNDVFSRTDMPLNLLGRLINGITPGEDTEKPAVKPNFSIIGPQSSNVLKKMFNELQKIAEICSSAPEKNICRNHNYHDLLTTLIFSPFATKNVEVEINGGDRNSAGFSLTGEANYDFKWLKDRVIRTISTNERLAKTLVCELALRGVSFDSAMGGVENAENKCPLSVFSRSQVKEKKEHIVLIGEWDTVYSRSLTESVKEQIKKYSDDQGSIDEWVHSFNYLRGIDGISAEQATSIQTNRKEDSQKADLSRRQSLKQLRRPTGSNQYDYLRRLVEHLEYLEKTKAKEGGIKAIGVLGSDPYDKLLILQALHKRFPRAVFFTTDLDARFLHPAELPWTRNLVVASSYGLKLHETLQRDTMPFRDNYQTALYLSTKLAIHCRLESLVFSSYSSVKCNDKNLQKIIDSEKLVKQPRLFEIGNRTAVDLSHTPGHGIHPEPEYSSDNLGGIDLMLFIAFIPLISFLLVNLTPKRSGPVVYLLASGLIGVLILYMILQSREDAVLHTFSFTNGTSTWPANAIRFFALITAIGFFIFLIRQLNRSNQKISEKFICAAQPYKDGQQNKMSDDKNWLSFLCVDAWHNREEKNNKSNAVYFIDLWNEYLKMREAKYCVSRVVMTLLLYAGCIIILNQTNFFEMPGIPARGAASHRVNELILSAVVLLYLVLIFTIADITHLSSHFIMLLRKNEVMWPREVLDIYINKYGVSQNEDLAKNKLKMDMISRLAGDVNSFIYYPFMILFLLILSRSHYFDNWHYTPLLFMIISFTAVIALGSAIRLRKAAINARDDYLEKLNFCYWQSIARDAQQKNDAMHHGIRLLTEEVKNLNTGPFQPIGRHPIVLSLLMPLGSVGGLYLIEYFLGAA
ncbi:hypothetical protein SAMN05421690_101645 [Nitrosomonas sp. Nm51]|nr:hypothetical protein SAMN05421690_101645 [Nitrosomonas sp. Nm51]